MSYVNKFVLTLCASVVAAGPVTAFAQDDKPAPKLVQPGAPGSMTKAISADDAIGVATTGFTAEDVTFMQNMIPHHQQAVEMSELVDDRTNNEDVKELAAKILASQDDEISFMQEWLSSRGQEEGKAHAHHHGMDHSLMADMGMATPEQMTKLAASEGVAFDEQFLRLMIRHHEGAIDMVDDLLQTQSAAYDAELYNFTNDVKQDQGAEIKAMAGILTELSDDPRAGLAAGFKDAGEAISNLKLVAALDKPNGFYDPANPAELPQVRIDYLAKVAAGEEDLPEYEKYKGEADAAGKRRPRFLDFANTDMAFFDNILVAGSYHGFNVYEIDGGGVPQLMSSIVCPGGQGDVSVVGDLLIMSVEGGNGRIDCGLQGNNDEISMDRFRGIRIFDITDLTAPVQVGGVQTCRGSHTHTVVAEDDDTIVVYNSGTSWIRKEEELAGCVDGNPGDSRTSLFRIDVIEIPKANPAAARIVDSPAVFADEETGELAGLWRGGDHGDNTQSSRRTDQCHDITIFPDKQLAAGACSGNGILFDISNPLEPKRIDAVTDDGFAYWHSATFSNDGTKVVFTDEWGGGVRPRCQAQDPLNWGANAVYDIVEDKLIYRSHYKMPGPQTETENCVAHNGSIIPVPGRDLFVQSWYQGGISIMDFTDSSNPKEIAFFDRGPIDSEELVGAGYWSTYFYNGYIYSTEIARGLDVHQLIPSEYLTENEIAAANLAINEGIFNPQQQMGLEWPAHPTVAMAYVDQLKRQDGADKDLINELEMTIGKAKAAMESGDADRSLAREVNRLARKARRVNEALAETLEGIGDTLRG
ncbi:MAG: DUF305 domain-containing protein [Pseudomonadota bacterium]